MFASFVFPQNSYCCTLHTTGQHKLAPSRAFPTLHFRKYLQRISPPFRFHHQHQISLAKYSVGGKCSCVVYNILHIMTHGIQISDIRSPEKIAFFVIVGLFFAFQHQQYYLVIFVIFGFPGHYSPLSPTILYFFRRPNKCVSTKNFSITLGAMTLRQYFC